MKSDEEKLLRILRDCLTRMDVAVNQYEGEFTMGEKSFVCGCGDMKTVDFDVNLNTLARELVDAGVTVKS